MDIKRHNQRPSGIKSIGDLFWGSRFCQFYQEPGELLEVLVPYFKAGIKAHEACLWLTDGDPDAPAASQILRKALPRFDRYLAEGRLEILAAGPNAAEKRIAQIILEKLDKAVLKGFEGLRVTIHTSRESWDSISRPEETDTLADNNVLAFFAIPRGTMDARSLMETMKSFHCALIRNSDRWEVIESAEAHVDSQALRRSEERVESLFKYMAEGFAYHRILLDENGKPCDYVFLEVNDAFGRILGIKPGSVVNKRVTRVLPGVEKDSADWIGKYGKVALTQEPLKFESHSETLNKWYSVSAFSPRKGYFAAIFNDITDRKRAEEELRKRTVELEASNKELEAFSYSVSHDLRAPLRTIDGFSEAVLEDYAEKLDAQGKTWLNNIRNSSQKMGELIEDILRLSRVARAEMQPEEVDLSDLARSVADELRASGAGGKARVIIAPEMKVRGDPRLLRIALTNLLDNAFKFSARTEAPRIEFGRAELGGKKYFRVKDNGAGFDMAYSDKLFKPFQRLHGPELYPGTGIGLVIVQRIVSRHGGSIVARGEVGKGAEFYFSLG